MTHQDLLDIALKNGGFTFGIKSGRLIDKSSGYMVSIAGRERIVKRHLIQALAIAEYIKDNLSILSSDNDIYFGAWISDDNVYLDVSIWIENRNIALSFGRGQKQIAIWDIANGCEVQL